MRKTFYFDIVVDTEHNMSRTPLHRCPSAPICYVLVELVGILNQIHYANGIGSIQDLELLTKLFLRIFVCIGDGPRYALGQEPKLNDLWSVGQHQ